MSPDLCQKKMMLESLTIPLNSPSRVAHFNHQNITTVNLKFSLGSKKKKITTYLKKEKTHRFILAPHFISLGNKTRPTTVCYLPHNTINFHFLDTRYLFQGGFIHYVITYYLNVLKQIQTPRILLRVGYHHLMNFKKSHKYFFLNLIDKSFGTIV